MSSKLPFLQYLIPLHRLLFLYRSCQTRLDFSRAFTWKTCRSLAPKPISHSKEEVGIHEVEGEAVVALTLLLQLLLPSKLPAAYNTTRSFYRLLPPRVLLKALRRASLSIAYRVMRLAATDTMPSS